MKIGIVALVSVLVVSLITGCGRTNIPDRRISGIVRVLMHEPNRYTLVYQKSNSRELESVTYDRIVKVTLIDDVPKGKDMWAIVKSHVGGDGATHLDEPIIDSVEIHLHNANDINGAGWDHGKFGRGQTNVVE